MVLELVACPFVPVLDGPPRRAMGALPLKFGQVQFEVGNWSGAWRPHNALIEINYINPGGVYEFNELFEVPETRGVIPWLGVLYCPRYRQVSA